MFCKNIIKLLNETLKLNPYVSCFNNMILYEFRTTCNTGSTVVLVAVTAASTSLTFLHNGKPAIDLTIKQTFADSNWK